MFNLPNILTMARVVLIPVFVLAFYYPSPWSDWIAAGIFVGAAITDYFDGYFARKMNLTSKFGAFLDPVADKLMVAVALALIVEDYAVFWVTLPAAVMICREILISALREWMAELGKRASVAVSVIGKYKTAAQMIALTGLIWNASPLIFNISIVAFYIATILTLWSMLVYLKAAWVELKD